MDLHLRGKRALVTGASKGIGAAIATVLAEEGCHLHLVARGKPDLEELAERLRRDHSVDVTVHPADLREPGDLTHLAETAPDVDILINNAGDIPGGTLENVDDQTWRHAWDLKVHGYINLTRLFYSRMRERGHGVITNVIGAAGERPDFHYIAGSAGNAALMAFTRALGGHSMHDGIRVIGINPGPVATDRVTALMGDKLDERLATLPAGRIAEPREIADAVAFLVSDRSAYTSGVIITIDGGLGSAG